MKPIGQQEVLQKLRDGWQLGSGGGGRDSHIWMQRELMCGGDSFNVHASSFQALLRKKAVVSHKRAGDPFWLTRWRLPK